MQFKDGNSMDLLDDFYIYHQMAGSVNLWFLTHSNFSSNTNQTSSWTINRRIIIKHWSQCYFWSVACSNSIFTDSRGLKKNELQMLFIYKIKEKDLYKLTCNSSLEYKFLFCSRFNLILQYEQIFLCFQILLLDSICYTVI